jgi:hypothetical protein
MNTTDTMDNDVTYELTVGLYEDLCVIGTYPTRELALQALGEYVLGTTQGGQPNRVEYPAINEIVQLQPWC